MKYLRILVCLILLIAIAFKSFSQGKKLSKPEKNFEIFWNTLNNNYAHFETRMVNWNDQYKAFRVKVNATTTDDELFSILTSMLEPLHDGHTSISRNGDLPASAKYSKFHARFPTKQSINNLREVTTKTLVQLGFTDYIKFNSKQFQIGGYSFNGNYCYLQLNGFGGLPLKEFEKQLDDMILKLNDKKAIIIDIRINGGGSPEFVNAVISRLISDKVVASYGQRKVGSGINDYTTLQEHYYNPNSSNVRKKMVLLTSGASISAADHFAMGLKGLDSVTIIGENTGGMFSSMMGQKLPNGWEYSLSNEKYLSRNKICYESIGVPVDIIAANTQKDIELQQDSVLKTAIEYLEK